MLTRLGKKEVVLEGVAGESERSIIVAVAFGSAAEEGNCTDELLFELFRAAASTAE
jgi:hypothetical protein